MASLADLVTVGNGINKNISQLIQAINAIFPRITGTITLTNAASTTVTQTATKANSIILLIPTNAAAATLMGGATALYVSARTVGASFVLTTANAAAAAGTETFAYTIVNPS